MPKLTKWQHSALHYLGDEIDSLDLGAARVVIAGPVARKKLAPVLRDDGYDVVEVPVGYEILRFVRTREVTHCDPADLIIVDLTRAPRRGLEVVEAIRMTDWSLPVIALCREDSHVCDELARLGVTTFSAAADTDDVRTAVINAVPPFQTLAAA